MIAAKKSRTSGLGTLPVVALSTLTFVSGVGLTLAFHKSPERVVIQDGAPASASEGRRERASDDRAATSAARPAPSLGAEMADRRRAETEHKAREVISSLTRQLLIQASVRQADGVEAQGQQMAPYLMGVVGGLRATDPALLREMGEALAERTCSHAQSDLELMMVGEMVQVAPEMGRPRTFDCGLGGRKTEDVSLWTMLDAWRNTGQPMPRSIAEIQDRATDERTKRRLSNYEQSMKERTQAADLAPPSASPPVATDQAAHEITQQQ